MTASRAVFSAAFLVLSVLASGAGAQSSGPMALAPPGSCLLPSGSWCWPTAPTTFGEPCQCPTSQGLQQGLTQ